MSLRTQIKVRLSPEGSAILGGIEWAILDLEPGFSPRLSKDINVLSDVNKLVTDGVLPFSLPFSTVNDAAFLSLSSPIITDNYDTGIEARIVVDSREMPFDRIWVKGKVDGSKRWEVEFRRSPNHWLELASKKMLCTVDMGSCTLTQADIDAGWADQLFVDGEAPYRWLPADYGGWVDLAEKQNFTDPNIKQMWIEDLRPFISLPAILKQAFCEIGWSLEGQLLESDYFRAMYLYLLDREYYTQSRGGLHKLIGASLNFDFTPGSSVGSPIPYETVQYDPGSNALPAGALYYGGITNNLPFRGRWRFCFTGILENTGSSGNVLGFSLYGFDLTSGFPNGEVYFEEPFAFELSAGQSKSAKFCAEIDLNPGQTAVFWIGYSESIIVKKGYRITIEPANKSLVRGDVVEYSKMVDCQYTLLDLFKGLTHLSNGALETDWVNRVLTIHPYRTTVVAGDSIPGFINEGDTPIDISNKIVCDSVQTTRVKNVLTRYTRVQFADSTDAYISSLELPEPAHSRKVLNGVDLEDRVLELKNPFFEPTMEGQPSTLRLAKNIGDSKTKPMVYMPRLWDNTDGQRSFVIAPRILFFYGFIEQLDPETGLEPAYFFEGGAARTQLAYASQLPTLPFSTAPAVNGNLVYGVAERDLYVLFYLAYLQRQKRGVYLDALVLLNATDYADWDFRTPFFFTYNGRPVLALGQSIRDFAPALDVPTPVKFLVEPSDTQCCDLPCSCRFKECNYYQDFGQFITQDTLDELSVTSFKVNGIEQIDSPVDFGIINVVEIGGKQFVTNLIDTLNSIGIAYFSFSPSTKDYPGKNDARFFKIKYPACWGFEIIISDSGGEVYRYRDFDMAQKWFGATWEPMGYSGTPVSTPQDCVTTVEY
jgi:hypothetical protein